MKRKGKYNKWWYSSVKTAIKHYRTLSACSPVERKYIEAIRRALADLDSDPCGSEKRKLIDLYLLKQTHTLQGAADQIPIGIWQAKRWISQFVYKVGGYVGF